MGVGFTKGDFGTGEADSDALTEGFVLCAWTGAFGAGDTIATGAATGATGAGETAGRVAWEATKSISIWVT